MPVREPRVVARVEHPQPGDLDHEHRGPEDVAGAVRRDAHAAAEVDRRVEVEQLRLGHRGVEVRLGVQGLPRSRAALVLLVALASLADADKVAKQRRGDRFRGVRHENPSVKAREADDVGQSCAVVEVEVSN